MKIDSLSNSSLYGSGVQATTGKTGANNSLASSGTGTQKSTASSTSTSQPDYYYDKRDLNKDGIVTLEEELLYALTQGEQLTSQAATQTGAAQSVAANYNQQGNVETASSSKPQAKIKIII